MTLLNYYKILKLFFIAVLNKKDVKKKYNYGNLIYLYLTDRKKPQTDFQYKEEFDLNILIFVTVQQN